MNNLVDETAARRTHNSIPTGNDRPHVKQSLYQKINSSQEYHRVDT